MDPLPEEVQLEILSHLNLNEQAACRLVSYSFKCLLEECLRIITHVQIGNEELNVYSSIYEDFLARKFVQASVRSEKMRSDERLSDSFYSFLSKFCPSLQVLYSAKSLHFNDLLKLPHLRFFKCSKLIFPPSTEENDAERLFSQMESLESLDAGPKTNPKHLLFLVKRLQKNKSIPILVNPSLDLLDKRTFASLAECGIKCLKYHVYEDEIHRLHPISEPVARHLKDLSIRFLPSDSYVQSPLLVLKYLQIENPNFYLDFPSPYATYENVLFSSPHLKYFRYKSNLELKLVHILFQHLSSLEELQDIDTDVLVKQDEPDQRLETISLDLPSSVHRFRFSTSVSGPCQLTLLSIQKTNSNQ